MSRLLEILKREWVLVAIVAGAFCLRIVGVGYGVPLLVVNDEPPYLLGALKMLQLQTLIPAFHPADFQTILYYPPYGSYVLLLPFALIIGIKYVLFSGSSALFQAMLIADLSPFIIAMRLYSVILGTLSVYLVYRIGDTVFKSRIAGLTSAFLLSTSVLHVSLSMVGRNWIITSAVFLIVLYLLTKETLSMRVRYFAAFLVAGIGMGFSPFCILALVMMGLYYVTIDVRALRQIPVEAPRMMGYVLMFIGLALIPYFLWHGGNNFTGSLTLNQQKSAIDFLINPWLAIYDIVFSEPIFVALFILGAAVLFVRERRLALFFIAWYVIYQSIFFIIFRFDSRFLLPILPVCALLGGYMSAVLWSTRWKIVVLLLLALPLVNSIRFSQLTFMGDTRQVAQNWLEAHLSSEDKVMVYSSAMHVHTKKSAVEELRALDASAVRAVDETDEIINNQANPHVLNNLTSVTNKDFALELPGYFTSGGYTYLLIEPRSLAVAPEIAGAFEKITRDDELVAKFEGHGDFLAHYATNFTRPFTGLFEQKLLGPDILIYHVR